MLRILCYTVHYTYDVISWLCTLDLLWRVRKCRDRVWCVNFNAQLKIHLIWHFHYCYPEQIWGAASLFYTLSPPPPPDLNWLMTALIHILYWVTHIEAKFFAVKSVILKIFISHFHLFKQISDLAYFYINEKFCRTVAPCKIWIDRPWSYSSSPTKNCIFIALKSCAQFWNY